MISLRTDDELESVVRNHALVDGNKRLAWFCAVVFMDLNSERVEMNDGDAFTLMIEAAQGALGVTEIAERIRPRT